MTSPDRPPAARLERVDPFDDAAHLEWFESIAAAESFDWPVEPGWSNTELAALNRDQSGGVRILALARDERGVPVGSCSLKMPTADNTDLAELLLVVNPGSRRRGVGHELATFAEEQARRFGRTKMVARTERPIEQKDSPGERFAMAHGFVPALAEERRLLEPLPAVRRLDSLEAEARSEAAGYEVVTWIGPCPDELVEGRARLAQSISTDAPQGALEQEQERWDVDRLRLHEQTTEEMGRELYAAGAVHAASGALVGISEIAVPRDLPGTSYQWDTVVDKRHRGHRLGTLLKLANLRQVADSPRRVDRILTWNAASNEHMIRVNTLIGYRLVGTSTAWKKVL